MHDRFHPLGKYTPEEVSSRFRYFNTTEKILSLWQEPTKHELTLLFDNPFEIAVIRSKNSGEWKALGGRWGEIDDVQSVDCNIIAHTHQSENDPNNYSLPSLNDVFFATRFDGKCFIVDMRGIFFFTGIKKHPETNKPWRPKKINDLLLLHEAFIWTSLSSQESSDFNESREEKLLKIEREFLKKIGVIVISKGWEELPNQNPLSSFAKEV
ncbi:MAG: hypothetical protein A3H17_01185 [Candidatus Levybacteria bacterium RIFCSPLOWO2_12_FULL_37_14]|nr:MAG: hypothetical protein US43_C0017G0008 [Candidatus Levybacteria bacterium GW2011_GWA1_37_16]KKQ36998.1 MAG: hypothetical protein US55_C0045G0006 [Candidatus Levybacteria bacterium GW2011_GWC2_37_7]KKQ42891.1 MAG: hypothetical protein US59_C0002G0020 [Candidatus Levybacteria bacterium GW2011_GWB1_37_8]OGH51578.1 MAG: hypothetical protein A3H17_01185 [Candidatus Levybacteria bacterium RIFCSPLOWO2_12_FULL_37_14]